MKEEVDDDIIVEYCDIKPVNQAQVKSGQHLFFILELELKLSFLFSNPLFMVICSAL